MKKLILLFVLLLLVLPLVACNTFQGVASNGALIASGTIAAHDVKISSEMAGKVKEVLVDEGQPVKAGDPLLRLDDSLLQSEKQSAQAALDSANASVKTAQVGVDAAQVQYDQTLSDALAAEGLTRLDSWQQTKPTQFDQPTWFFSKDERLQSAQAEVDAAKAKLEDKQTKLSDTEKKAGSANFLAVEQKLSDVREAFEVAQTVLDHTNGSSDGTNLHDDAQTELDDAKINLDNAQKDYDDALTTDGAKDVLDARAQVEVARERYSSAMDALRALQTGAQSPVVASAGKALERAKAVLDQTQSAVNQAQANLDAINTQMDKLIVYAPMDGVVLDRNVEPGEFIQPGSAAIVMANLNELTITVYVPENQYGKITIGQQAQVSVDSFPGVTYEGTVSHIANQAEFTPRNVQTADGRKTTVYAIKILVPNEKQSLKPGMPVDVEF